MTQYRRPRVQRPQDVRGLGRWMRGLGQGLFSAFIPARLFTLLQENSEKSGMLMIPNIGTFVGNNSPQGGGFCPNAFPAQTMAVRHSPSRPGPSTCAELIRGCCRTLCCLTRRLCLPRFHPTQINTTPLTRLNSFFLRGFIFNFYFSSGFLFIIIPIRQCSH